MKTRPILFSTGMVRAILEGRKTQTRRVIKNVSSLLNPMWDGKLWVHIGNDETDHFEIKCPHGKPGGLLWVRETHLRWTGCGEAPPHWRRHPHDEIYESRAYFDDKEALDLRDNGAAAVTVPSIFMPRWASRLTLKILNIKAERLQDISGEDAKAEGVKVTQALKILSGFYPGDTHKIAFKNLWDSINAKPKPIYKKIDGKRTIIYYESFPWEDIKETRQHRGKPWYVTGNPWVWAIGFSPIKKNVDEERGE